MKLRGVSLYPGIGGLPLALATWVTPIAYCERDPFAQEVLGKHFREHSLEAAPLFPDVVELAATAEQVFASSAVDIVFGEFSCENMRKGSRQVGTRADIVKHALAIVDATRAPLVFIVNVRHITNTYHCSALIEQLARRGYALRWGIFTARNAGAPHMRDRWFCLGRRVLHPLAVSSKFPTASLYVMHMGRKEHVLTSTADAATMIATCASVVASGDATTRECATAERQWSACEPEPRVARAFVPLHMERLAALGNAVVPQQARLAFIALLTHDRAAGSPLPTISAVEDVLGVWDAAEVPEGDGHALTSAFNEWPLHGLVAFELTGPVVVKVVPRLQQADAPSWSRHILANGLWATPMCHAARPSHAITHALRAMVRRSLCLAVSVRDGPRVMSLEPPLSLADANAMNMGRCICLPRGAILPADATVHGEGACAAASIGFTNPEWVEWLMGYPPRWTLLYQAAAARLTAILGPSRKLPGRQNPSHRVRAKESALWRACDSV